MLRQRTSTFRQDGYFLVGRDLTPADAHSLPHAAYALDPSNPAALCAPRLAAYDHTVTWVPLACGQGQPLAVGECRRRETSHAHYPPRAATVPW